MSTPDAARVDLDALLAGLDRIFADHRGATDAEPHLRAGLAEAEARGDHAARLSILNELAGLYRSLSRHEQAVTAAHAAVALADEMCLEGSQAYATTLINAATALRAAGRLDAAREAYGRALAAAHAAMPATDRRLAALHNNLSILHSEAGDPARARDELWAALAILEASSVDPAGDVDIATTLTNLSLVEHELGRGEDATAHAARSMEIFGRGGHERDPHVAAALAGHAEASFRLGRPADAVALYRQALGIVAECYGAESEAYTVTAENLAHAERAAASATAAPAAPAPAPAPAPGPAPAPAAASATATAASAPQASGLELARTWWGQHVRPMLERHPELRGRVAVGLVGHGSECYGFDDALSRDHDFGPGVCLWLTEDDFAAHGAALQADYDALPTEVDGHGPRLATPRARGAGRRVGVFPIGAFFESVTGYPAAPAADRPHEWMLLDEATLAAATNGAVFADPLGAFSAVRNGFRRMPEDVRLARLGQRLGMIAQAGQYNVPRMLDRGDGEAAWLAVAELVRASASAVFLLNGPSAVGYLPYYKWQFAALRDLAARMGARLPEVHRDLTEILRLASAACLGGAGFGEGGKGAAPARVRLEEAIARLAAAFVGELRAQGLSTSADPFLEPHRDQVRARISDEWLRAL